MANITVSEDASRGLGWASIRVSPKPPQDAGICILRRQSDKPYLGPSGWQSQKHSLIPGDISPSGDAVEFHFGPEVTSHLVVDQDIDVMVDGTSIQKRLFWPEIMGSQPSVRGAVAGVPSKGDEVREKIAVNTIPPGGSGIDDAGSGIIDPDDEVPRLQSPLDPLPTDRGDRSRASMLAAGLTLLLLGAGAFYWFDGPDPSATQTTTQDRVVDDETTQSDQPAAPAQSFSERYEAYRVAGGHGEELYRLYDEAMQAGEVETAERAIVLSANRDSAAANILLGQWKDPGAEPHRFSDPQPAAALRYYCRALQLGSRAAEPLLAALRARAESPPADEIEMFELFSGECSSDQE